MKWTTIETIVCPKTGIAFSAIVSYKMLKLIIWHEGSLMIPAGSTIEPDKNGIKINNIYQALTIYNVTPFNAKLWRNFKKMLQCTDAESATIYCQPTSPCVLKFCPYGKIKKIFT